MKEFKDGVWGPVNANNFEIKPSLISMIQQEQFSRRAIEDPNEHLRAFLEICDTIKQNGVPTNTIRLRMFGFSLRGNVKLWFNKLDRTKVQTWEQFCTLFLDKFFPPAKAHKLIVEIHQFSQFSDETLHEAWDRFKGLLRQCPQHGLSDEEQVIQFYNGLIPSTRSEINSTSNGCLLDLDNEDATNLIEKMVAISSQWPTTRTSAAVSRMHPDDKDAKYDSLLEKFTILKNQYEKDKKGKGSVAVCDDADLPGDMFREQEVNYVN